MPLAGRRLHPFLSPGAGPWPLYLIPSEPGLQLRIRLFTKILQCWTSRPGQIPPAESLIRTASSSPGHAREDGYARAIQLVTDARNLAIRVRSRLRFRLRARLDPRLCLPIVKSYVLLG
jgi:hypothetical protein